MKRGTIIRSLALMGVIAIVLGTIVPALSAFR